LRVNRVELVLRVVREPPVQPYVDHHKHVLPNVTQKRVSSTGCATSHRSAAKSGIWIRMNARRADSSNIARSTKSRPCVAARGSRRDLGEEG
jgi:hypothetical protein